MIKRWPSLRWTIFALIVGLFILAVNHMGQIFFLNLTPSMPTGIYLKTSNQEIKIGDIIIFNTEFYKNKLIKYVAARGGDEFCIDDGGALWVNGEFIAQKNIYKFNFIKEEKAICQKLRNDELLVLGEHPDSFDSRYFGPIKFSNVSAKIRLLITLAPEAPWR